MIFSARSLVVVLALVASLCVASPLAIADDALTGGQVSDAPVPVTAPADPAGYDALADSEDAPGGIPTGSTSQPPASPSALTVGQSRFNQWLHAARNSENVIGWFWHHDILGGSLLDPRDQVVSTRELVISTLSTLEDLRVDSRVSMLERQRAVDSIMLDYGQQRDEYNDLKNRAVSELKKYGYDPNDQTFQANNGERLSVPELKQRLAEDKATLKKMRKTTEAAKSLQSAIDENEAIITHYEQNVGYARVYLSSSDYRQLCDDLGSGCNKLESVISDARVGGGYNVPALVLIDATEEAKSNIEAAIPTQRAFIASQLAVSAAEWGKQHQEKLSELERALQVVPGAWILRLSLKDTMKQVGYAQDSTEREVQRWQSYKDKQTGQ